MHNKEILTFCQKGNRKNSKQCYPKLCKFHFLNADRKKAFHPMASRPNVNLSPFDIKREYNQTHTDIVILQLTDILI